MKQRPAPVTIKDIAQHLGLAKSTVSYALNGGPRQVSTEVRNRVREAAEELGFRPNPVALSLATRRTRTIGFVPSSLEPDAMVYPLAQAALQAIFRAAHDREMHVLLPSGYDPNRSEETRENLLAAPVDGLILLLAENPRAMSALKARGVPMIGIIGRPDKLFPTVNADNVGGVRCALDHLIELGHRRIATAFDDSHVDTSARYRAYQRMVDAAALDPDPELRVRTAPTEAAGYEAGKKILRLSPRPTAIIAVNDHVASGCMRAAYGLGIRVPDDLSVVGFDDDLIGRNAIIPLTTVHQPVAEMALAAFLGILDLIEGIPVPDQVLPCRLMIRNSTAPPRNP